MTPTDRNYIIYLEDILTSMSRIFEYIGEKDFKDFKQNYMIVDAVVRNFEIIGEASKNIPDNIKENYPEIPWKRMIGLRNIVIHAYFGIDLENIWIIITENIPEVKPKIIEILDAIKNEENTD